MLLDAGAAATGRAVLLGTVLDMAGSCSTNVGCASTGRRYEEPRFCGKLSGALRRLELATRDVWVPLVLSMVQRGHVAEGGGLVVGGTCRPVVYAQGARECEGSTVTLDWLGYASQPGWIGGIYLRIAGDAEMLRAERKVG
jgi:hypothetical protein